MWPAGGGPLDRLVRRLCGGRGMKRDPPIFAACCLVILVNLASLVVAFVGLAGQRQLALENQQLSERVFALEEAQKQKQEEQSQR